MPETLITWSEDEWQHIAEAADLYGCSPETIIKTSTMSDLRPKSPDEIEQEIEAEKRRLLDAADSIRRRERGEGI